jgi:septum formation protein
MSDFITLQGPFRPKKPIILASASPRRQSLLSGIGLHFQVVPSKFREPLPLTDQNAEDYALQNAESKARKVLKLKIPGVILAADTIVALRERILGKPSNAADAKDYLDLLCGQTHTVITACYILDPDTGQREKFNVKTKVKLARWENQLLMDYINTGEPLDKAGAYAIQGVGSFMVQSIRGSYTNVVGLPLSETVKALLRMGAICLSSQGLLYE